MTPVIAVASGKGGVGKTSVAVALARELVRRGRRTGLLDADLHGPDVPRMLGIRRDRRARSVTLTATKGSGTPSWRPSRWTGSRSPRSGSCSAATRG